MALTIRSTKELINPDSLKLKILLFGLHGTGKTTFMSTAPNLGAGICENGHGRGLLSVASKQFEYAELNAYDDFDVFCSGGIFKDKVTLGLDSLSEMVRRFIKDKALSLPRAKGESQKRIMGVPEIDDYGVMAELTRKLLQKLIQQDKHVVVTSGLRIDRPDPENGQTEMLIGPDLPGQMFLGSTAMFDIVLCLRTRSILRNSNDAKSRYSERYFITENTGGVLAKNRLSVSDKGISFLPSEVIFDQEKGTGTFAWFLTQAQDVYKKWLIDHAAVKA
jgi:hypothetical protein